MSGILSDRATRRDVLKSGGVLVVGFALFGRGSMAAAGLPVVPPKKPWSVDHTEVDSWLVVHPDNTVTLYVGKVELGQGTLTGLMQIAAEELDLDLSQLRAAPVDTVRSPDQWSTARSAGIQEGGMEVRVAAAEARRVLLQRAALRLRVDPADLSVVRGIVSVRGQPGQSTRYGDLLESKRFDVSITGSAPLKPTAEFRLVGTRVPRIDIPAKVSGEYTYMQHVSVPGMFHGRVVRPQGQGAYGTYFRLEEVDEASIADFSDVRIIRRGDFLGVVSPSEWHAVKAARRLKVRWLSENTLPGNSGLHGHMRQSPTKDSIVEAKGDAEAALARSAHLVSATFRAPYQAHAPMAPNCAIADVKSDSAQIISSTHHPFDTPEIVAKVIGLKPENVRVQYVEGSGTYGRSNFDDAAQAAAIMSQAVGGPVRVQFERGDEIAWDAYGPAHLADVRVAADSTGKLIAYDYIGLQHGWMEIEPTEEHALGTRPVATTAGVASCVNKFNAGAMYDIPNKRLLNRHISGLDGSLRASALRSPMDIAISFASEQAIDELAFRVGFDPVEFRRRNILSPRWLGVLNAVVHSAGWRPEKHRQRQKDQGTVSGRGVGLGTHFVSYGAAIADVTVNVENGEVRVHHIHAALDCGQAVNPGLVENQIVGMCQQATSRMLYEEVRFDMRNVTSRNWNSYPVLRFAEHPQVTPIVIQRTGEPSTGAGEEAMGATTAAIANAFFDATGKRMYEFPLTPDRVLAALLG